MKWMKVACILFSLVWVADGTNEKDIGVSVEELYKLIHSKKVTIVDVRMPWELKTEGKIAASINIPVQKVENAFSLSPEEFGFRYGKKMPAKDDCNLIFHCKSGKRSFRALTIARKMGWTCARHLIGGFNAWKYFYY